GLAAVAATGLPPFGLFYSELTVIGGGFAASKTLISILVLLALIASFCGILKQLTRILLGSPRPPVAQVSKPAVSPTSKSAGRRNTLGTPSLEASAGLETRDTAGLETCAITSSPTRSMGETNPAQPPSRDGIAAMTLLLSALLLFSVWLPAPVFQLIRQAAAIIGGNHDWLKPQ